jgi:hypothetical protein
MTVNEAYDLIDAVRGMFSELFDEAENGDEGEGFLDTPVHDSFETVYDSYGGGFKYDTRHYYTQVVGGDEEIQHNLPDITPVCSFLVNEWPSADTQRIRKKLEIIYRTCINLCKEHLDTFIDFATDDGYTYYIQNQKSQTIKSFLLNTIHEMYLALSNTDDDTLDFEFPVINKTQHELMEKIKDLEDEVNQLKAEKTALEKQIEEINSEESSKTERGIMRFTSRQMGIFLYAVAQKTEDPAPAKTTIGEVVENISGYKAKTVNQNMKGVFSEKDKETVAKAIETKLPELAKRIRKI